MGRHTIECYLSEKSFLQAAQELRQYTDNFKRKCEDLGVALAQHGYNTTSMVVTSIPYDEKGDITVNIQGYHGSGRYEGIISIGGEQCVFIEFGSGITYNSSAGSSLHSKGDALGLTIDSYNPSGTANIKGWGGSNATNPKGWYTPEGEHTYGTHTYMPLEKGIDAIISDLTNIARSVFV